MLLTCQKNLSELGFTGKKFIRRTDLTESIRASIAVRAYLAKETSEWGIITFLAQEYNISRSFIYDMLFDLTSVCSILFNKEQTQMMSISRQMALEMILSLRLEGKCSIETISVIMKRFESPCSAVGFISEYLNEAGSLVFDTFKNDRNETQCVVFLSDEIFAKKVPILVTVDAVSSAILKIELTDTRKADDWIKHWNCIEDNGHMAIYLVAMRGQD